MAGQLDHAVEAFDFERDASTERRMHLICLEVNDNGQEFEQVEQRKRKIKRKNFRPVNSLQCKQSNTDVLNGDVNRDEKKLQIRDEPCHEINDSLESNDQKEPSELPETPNKSDSLEQPSKLVFSGLTNIWPSEDLLNGRDEYENEASSPEFAMYDFVSPLFLGNNAQLRIMIDLLPSGNESIVKTFMCYKGGLVGVHHRPPLVFLVVTSKAIYLLNHVYESHLFTLELRTSFDEMKDIVIETGSQGLIINQRKMHLPMQVCTACQELTELILETIESTVLTGNFPLPEIRDASQDVTLVKKSLVTLEEELEMTSVLIEHFSLIYFLRSASDSELDASSILNSTELMSNFDQGTFGCKEGMLMYRLIRSDEVSPWTPGYFVLSNGYIYCYTDASKSNLNFFSQLFNNHCKGCRRLNDETITRPHVLEVKLVVDNVIQILHLAASSEADTTDWILNLFTSIDKDTPEQVGRFDGRNCLDKFCYLTLTQDTLYTLIRDVNSDLYSVLEKVAICDIVSALISCVDESSSFCYVTLELESSNNVQDWTLYFLTPQSRQCFMDQLSKNWEQLFQVSFQVMQHDFSDQPNRKQVLERLISWHKNAASALTD